MPAISILFGALLCGLSAFTAIIKGDGFYFGTWLIPAGFGVVLAVLGLISILKPGARKHAMHTAALVGTIGALMSLGRGVPALFKLMDKETAEQVNMLAFGNLWGMAILCTTFVGVCVQSFIAARKARQAAEGNSSKG